MASEARALGTGARVAIGEAALAAALAGGARAVVSFGLCGALDPELLIGDLVIGEAVASPMGTFPGDEHLTGRLAATLTRARRVFVAGSESIVCDRAGKAALRARTGAAVADMESHLAAQAAAAAGAPFVIVRAVSDAADDDLPAAAMAGFRRDGRADVVAVLAALARAPWQLPALVRTARHANIALTALARCAPAVRKCVG
jgi:hopanoid-associated phosphorylase